MMEVNELIAEAERSLRDADPLCVDANAYYAELRLLIEQATVLWARILFLHAGQQDQLQSMGNICLVIRNGVEKAQFECKHQAKSMKRKRSSLRELLASLKQTTLDSAFKGHETLYQYVHEADIAALETQVDSLADDLQKKIAEVEQLPDKIQQQLGELRALSPELPPIVDTPQRMVRMASRAAPYANDMAVLLTSLTSHYDLCSQIPHLTSGESAEAIQVAMGDRAQVSTALERLKECRQQLRHKHKEAQRLQHSLAMSFEQLKGFDNSVTSFISNTLRPALLTISAKHAEFRELFVRAESITNELNGLSEYYRLFRKSYHALVIEITRRHESSKQVRKIVENANNALRGFQTRESDIRQSFIDTYQEFLPTELWPKMSDMPKEYHIQFEEETLPELGKSTLLNALKENDQ